MEETISILCTRYLTTKLTGAATALNENPRRSPASG